MRNLSAIPRPAAVNEIRPLRSTVASLSRRSRRNAQATAGALTWSQRAMVAAITAPSSASASAMAFK